MTYSNSERWSRDLQSSPHILCDGEVIIAATHTSTGVQDTLQVFNWDGRELWSRAFEQAMINGLIAFEVVRADGLSGHSKVFVSLSSADLLYGEGSVLALDVNGQDLWRRASGGQKISALAITNDHLYFTVDTKMLVCLDAATGQEVRHWLLLAAASTSAPRIDGDLIFIPCRGPQLSAYDLNGQLHWSFRHDDATAWLDKTPLVIDEQVIVVSSHGEVLVLDRKTGALKHRVPIGPTGKPLSEPATNEAQVFIGARDGVYALDPLTGRIVWHFATQRSVGAAPVVTGDVVYAACHDHRLYALNAQTGDRLWDYAAAHRIEIPPLVSPDHTLIFVADQAGILTALERPLNADELVARGRWREAAEQYAAEQRGLPQAAALTEYARQLEHERRMEEAGAIWEQAAQLFSVENERDRLQDCQREAARCRQQPILSLDVKYGELRQGEWSQLDFSVTNIGFGLARSVIIHAEGDQFEGQVAATQRIAALPVKRSQTEQLDIKPRAVGRVPLRLKVDYADQTGASHSFKHTLYVDVKPFATTTTRSGGIDINAQHVTIVGDVVGHDKQSAQPPTAIESEAMSKSLGLESSLTPRMTTTPAIDVQTLRVDAAVPEQVFVQHVFDLALAVKQMTSPLLAVKDLTHVESGEVQTTWEAGTPLINLRAEVEAPDCEVIGKRSIPFHLVRGQDSPLLRFQLKPLRVGELSLVVTIYQEDYWLGSARVNTIAAEPTTQPAGKVQISVASQPLWLDCEIRVHDRSSADYKVELTLNGEQVVEGWLSAEAASFVPTGDRRADGQRLFDLLLADPELREAWGEARGRSQQRRLRLRLDPRELRGLPWELLRDKDDLLAAAADTPFSRYLPINQPWGGAITARPIRVLAVVSNPIDLQAKYNLPQADVELEEQTLRKALSLVGSEGVALTFLSPPMTLERLEEELQQGYHILHFIGHGAFDAKQQRAAVYLQNEAGAAARVIAADFCGMLDRLAAPPQLIVLAACQSATQSLQAAFSGLGPQLVKIGVPAVVAMQDNVTVLTARQFGAKFYRRLLEHGTVDLAMNEARSTLITNGRYDAAVPVLFMRLRDGHLWSAAVPAAATPSEPHPPLGRAPLSQEERESLERQLKSARENLQLIEERKAEYVLGVEVPLQLEKEERRLRAKIAELEAKLHG